MRKTLAAVILALTLVLAGAPFASAVNNLEPCPRVATLASLHACELPAYPEEAEPVVSYYYSGVILLQNLYGAALERIALQQATIGQQSDKIARQRARILRLRERLSNR